MRRATCGASSQVHTVCDVRRDMGTRPAFTRYATCDITSGRVHATCHVKCVKSDQVHTGVRRAVCHVRPGSHEVRCAVRQVRFTRCVMCGASRQVHTMCDVRRAVRQVRFTRCVTCSATCVKTGSHDVKCAVHHVRLGSCDVRCAMCSASGQVHATCDV